MKLKPTAAPRPFPIAILALVLIVAAGCSTTSELSPVSNSTTILGTNHQQRVLNLREDLNWFISYPLTFRDDAFLAKGVYRLYGEDSSFVYFRAPEAVRFRSVDLMFQEKTVDRSGPGGIYLDKRKNGQRTGFFMENEDGTIIRLMEFDRSFYSARDEHWELIPDPSLI